MNPQLLAGVLLLVLTGSALGGPWLQRKATPLLVRFPRVAMWSLVGSAVLWVVTALALGPLLAWSFTGPSILPDVAGQVCQRCLDAANPFGASPMASSFPVVFLLVVPMLGALGLAAVTGLGLWRQELRTRQTVTELQERGHFERLLGYRVWVVADAAPIALTLPRRHLGVVLSTGTLRLLDTPELRAVLAHETAHLHQRHHAITAFMTNFARPLQWVPMIAAAQDALGHYLEIAADDAARDCAGTTALVSALLKLGQRGAASQPSTEPAHDLSGTLHLNGPNRIHHLVMPPAGSAGLVFAVLAATCLSVHALLASSVYVPYLLAGLTGCAL